MIDIRDLELDKVFFHFTSKDNLSNIMNQGLIPKIGENSNGIEKTEKIFFSVGSKGTMEIFNVWIKWLIKKEAQRIYTENSKDKQDYCFKSNKFHEDFLSGKIFKNEKIKEAIFNFMYQYMKSNVYLVLSLEENIDFRYDDIDEAKERANIVGNRKYMNVLYNSTSLTDTNMERWNMHTISGNAIEPSKIRVVANGDNIDAISIIKYIYSNSLREDLDITLLDEFIEYIQVLEEEKERKY